MDDRSRFDRCRWIGCHASCVDEIELCRAHYYEVGISFIDNRSMFGSKWREANAEHRAREREAAKLDRERAEEARAEAMRSQSVVYYVRIGDHVKIGYTINLRQRLGALRVDPEHLLATEPGGREQEAQRHAEFAAERVGRREDFNPSRRLLSHIEAIREKHGEPVMTTWVGTPLPTI